MPRGIEVTQARAGRANSRLPVAVAASRTVKHGLIPAQSRLIVRAPAWRARRWLST